MSKKTIKKRAKSKTRKQRTDLKSVLQSIYHDTVSLETTCNHSGICCNVACPSMNYSEFVQIANVLWNTKSHNEIVELICTSLEYFFKYEYAKWGKDSLNKPCMMLNDKGLCAIYEDRPLNCRLYGLWPEKDYESRVQKFVKAYESYNLKKEDLPLSSQCPFVKRVDDSKELTSEVIQGLFDQLDKLDQKIADFSDVQVRQRENYRTFHDWLLLKIFGESWLSGLTTFVLAASRETMESQIEMLKEVIRNNFVNSLPNIS
jgi:Fe-S-cluster containining protein